ncbi:TetR/AcrR family transcriptional regulator C-terminal domain-containing protein [Micromonospora sp. NPDC003197]
MVGRTRGQRAGLTRAAVLEAAMTLADREGLAALSMRRLGAELGVEAMTLYHHVASKDALLDGLVERLFVEAAPPRFTGLSWREGLRSYAHSLRAALLAHPNVIPLVVSRPALTPQNLRIMEDGLAALAAAGFPLERALDVVYSLSDLVVGHVATRGGGTTTHQRGRPVSVPDPEQFPLLTEAVRAEQHAGPSARFDFALDAMLVGFEAARVPDGR